MKWFTIYPHFECLYPGAWLALLLLADMRAGSTDEERVTPSLVHLLLLVLKLDACSTPEPLPRFRVYILFPQVALYLP